MVRSFLTWLGLIRSSVEHEHGHDHHGHDHDHRHDDDRNSDPHGHASAAHAHTHGVVDPAITTSERGIWAIKWSFVLLGVTALMQVVVVWFSGSLALLADTVHNFADVATALPLWAALCASSTALLGSVEAAVHCVDQVPRHMALSCDSILQ
jgi:Co/Zn/Cd efflux system component